MPYRFIIALAALLCTSLAIAWDVECRVDDFTDKESCRIHYVESGNFFGVALSDDGQDIALAAGDTDSLFDDTFLIRVDDQPHRDIEDTSFEISSRSRGFVLAVLDAETGIEAIQEIMAGEKLNVRLRDFNGPNKDMSFSTDGFDDAWNEFRERTGF